MTGTYARCRGDAAMQVLLYDRRTDAHRSRDVPVPLREELVLSRFVRTGPIHASDIPGYWHHDIYRQRSGAVYDFAFECITHDELDDRGRTIGDVPTLAPDQRS